MYTQCPDCSTSFRVTAEVLKQAAGKVRCGGCGNAFNALEYLSEQKPQRSATKEADSSLPELKPESTAKDDGLPKSISAKQSAALLKTLDELAGSDIRIEDTGVEWRVFDDDETSTPAADDDMADIFDGRESIIDEVLDESPTPVDQFLTQTPNDIDSAEIFAESANGPAKTPVDELRFDDNTPLPDDFDLDDESSYTPQPVVNEPEPEPPIEDEEPQADFDLSEPDDWEGILDEFDDLAEPAAPAPLEAELAALGDAPEELSLEHADHDSAVASQELLDMDTQFALQAEAMGIDLSGMHEAPEVEAGNTAEAAEPEPEVAEEPSEEPEEVLEEETDTSPEEALEEVPGDELEEELDDELGQLELIEEGDEAPLEFGSVERELADLEAQSDVFDSSFFKAKVAGVREEAEPELEQEQLELAGEQPELAEEQPELAEEPALEDELEFDEDLDLEAQPDLVEELPLAASPYPEEELGLEAEPGLTAPEQDDSGEGEHVVPPMTEEEQTINMMIDQDLLSLAMEDKDGFASTIVIPDNDKDAKTKKKDKKKRKKDKKKRKKDKRKEKAGYEKEAPGFETIIMEGEFVRSAYDEDKREADSAAAAELVRQTKARDAELAAKSTGGRARLVGGLVVLLLLLVVQVLHQSREMLATNPTINKVIAPLYRAIGKPLSPAWDITGWRIEATKGSIEGDDEKLVVYSRIGNNSDESLPYPIINISLTDRFEETLGSQQLDPAEYLPNNLDPSKLVQPGENFNAVISIQSPAADASGYELDVCYRVSNRQLRCAIEDFK